MVEINIIAVGKIKERSIARLVTEYTNRIRHDVRIEHHEIRDSDVVSEGKAIAAMLQKQKGFTFCLSEEGKQYNSVAFARRIEPMHAKINFVIGGPFGLSTSVKEMSGELLSLSPMTFPHEMARLMLLEQIYRAYSILRNRKYHK